MRRVIPKLLFNRRRRALRRWWRMPDQYLLRRETRWAVRWLTRSAGIWWLIAALGLAAMFVYAFLPASLNWEFEVFLAYCIFMVSLLGLWLWLMIQRAYLFSADQQLEDIASARFKPLQLWPGLLAAPVLIPSLLFIVCVPLPCMICSVIACISEGKPLFGLVGAVCVAGLWLHSFVIVMTFMHALSALVMRENYDQPGAVAIIRAFLFFGTMMFSWFFMLVFAGFAMGMFVAVFGGLTDSNMVWLLLIMAAIWAGMFLLHWLAALFAGQMIGNLRKREIMEMFRARSERRRG